MAVTSAAFPAGESTSLPGWDGTLNTKTRTAWFPKGRSYWEFTCESKVTGKANKDYGKRTKRTAKRIRSRSALIIVTARKWPGKNRWLQTKVRANQWADIRALDADDLEQWLEQNSAVALQLAEELGTAGIGIHSAQRHWQLWSEQCQPPISATALLADRESTRTRFLEELSRRLQGPHTGRPYVLKADSVDEATAFASAAIVSQPQISASTVVVTDALGWQFVERNPGLKVVIAGHPELAAQPPRKDGLVVIIPYAAGDMAEYFRAAPSFDHHLSLERPNAHAFEKALASIGVAEADAKRLAATTGRSWSVFRRHHSVNPAIRTPRWLSAPAAPALSTLCLLGGWSADHDTDRRIVARVSGRDYEEVDRDLRSLALMDDAPALHIGAIWKAKSSLELLDLFGNRITREELDRFFSVVRELLSAPDPQLELADEQRYAAQIYGKARPESGILVRSFTNTLVKLAVRGPYSANLSALDIDSRIGGLVASLLHGADETRWLSLSSVLPLLAEAAPDPFLKAVEDGLALPGAPPSRLLTESRASGLLGRSWHAGLLWALEILAWAPDRLARVALLLARLAHVPIQGNWGNTPSATLLDLFRSWIPQTAASLPHRIAVIDTLIVRDPDVAFDLLYGLLHVGSDHASPCARPKWRDDDVGAGHGVSSQERHDMLASAADRLITCAARNPTRVARLVRKISILDPPRLALTLELAGHFASAQAADNDKDTIRSALRERLHWHRNYDKSTGPAATNRLLAMEAVYERLVPTDLVVRHRWLFADSWPHVPVRIRRDHVTTREALIANLRAAALREVHAQHGTEGVERLATVCNNSYGVGVTQAQLGLDTGHLAHWIVTRGGDLLDTGPLTATISGLLRALPVELSIELIRTIVTLGQKNTWHTEKTARILASAPHTRPIWELAAGYGQEVEDAFWRTAHPAWLVNCNAADLQFTLRRFLQSGRPRTALKSGQLEITNVEPELLAEILEHVLAGEEPTSQLPDSWYIGEAIERLETSGAIDKSRLVRLEFGLFPALGHEGEARTRSLYEAITSEPEVFTELIRILYKASSSADDGVISEEARATATTAWRVLEHCYRQPGTRADGTIDSTISTQFIERARELCRQADRLIPADTTLGAILARASAGSDGVWPPEAVRDILDRAEHEDIREGFRRGVFKKHGSTSRAYDEGGNQERGLAETYRSYARSLQVSHTNLAAMLNEIARAYDSDGRRYDVEASLRIEEA